MESKVDRLKLRIALAAATMLTACPVLAQQRIAAAVSDAHTSVPMPRCASQG